MIRFKSVVIVLLLACVASCCARPATPRPIACPNSIDDKQRIEQKTVLLRRPMGAVGDFLVVMDEEAWYPIVGQPFAPGRSVHWSFMLNRPTTQPNEPDEIHSSESGFDGFVGDGEPTERHLVNAWLRANNVVVVLENQSSGYYYAMVIGYGATAATQADLMTDAAAPNLSADISGEPALKNLTITLSGPNARRRFVYNDWDQKWHEISGK